MFRKAEPLLFLHKPVTEELEIVLLNESVQILENTILIYGVIFVTNKTKTVLVIRYVTIIQPKK